MGKENDSGKKKQWLNYLCIIAPAFLAGFVSGAALLHFTHKEEKKQETEIIQKAPVQSLENKIESARSMPNSARQYNLLGLEAFSKKNYEAAETAFGKALEINPYYEVALGNLINVKFVMKKYDGAITLIQRQSKVKEEGVLADLRRCYLAYAADLLVQKKPEHAQQKMECFFDLKPETEEFGDGANLYLKIAGFYFAAEDYPQSISVGKRLLALIPAKYQQERAKIYSNLAISYFGLAEQTRERQYLQQTGEHLKIARELDPDNTQIKGINQKYEQLLGLIEASSKK